MGGAGESLPLRPQTIGELLDAATNLLRRHAAPLIGAGFVLALAEQFALYPLRRASGAQPPWYLPEHLDSSAGYWLLLTVGLGTETVIVALLGGLAGRAAAADLLGTPLPHGPLRPDRRLGALALLALILGAVSTLGSFAGLVPGVFWYLLAGLAAPVLMVDRRLPAGGVHPAWPYTTGPTITGPFAALGPFGAIGRSVSLVTGGGWRPGGIRLLGYLTWWIIRIGLGAGSLALLDEVLRADAERWLWPMAIASWAIVNAIAYPALGCLDAVVHLENRMRVEGLDIALSRARHLRRPGESTLAVPR